MSYDFALILYEYNHYSYLFEDKIGAMKLTGNLIFIYVNVSKTQ